MSGNDADGGKPKIAPQRIFLLNANGTNYLNSSNSITNGKKPRASSSSINMSAADLNNDSNIHKNNSDSYGAADKTKVPLITPTNARFEFARPLKHQASSSSMSSTSVNNLNLTSPSPIRSIKSPDKSINSTDKNAKYLSVIDLYDDDDAASSVPSPAQVSQTAGNESLKIESNGLRSGEGNKDTILTPTSISSFNFVSKGFEDSSDDLSSSHKQDNIFNYDRVYIDNDNSPGFISANPTTSKISKHKKQETLYYSPQSSIDDLDHLQKGDQINGEGKNRILEKSLNNQITSNSEQVVLSPTPNNPRHLLFRSLSQKHIKAPAPEFVKTVHKAISSNNLNPQVRLSTTEVQIKPVSYATTPSTNTPKSSRHLKAPSSLSGISINLSRGLESNSSQSRQAKGGSNLANSIKTSDNASSVSNLTASNASNLNVKNFINNNQSLLSLQTSSKLAFSSRKIQIESDSKQLSTSDRDRYGFKKKNNFVSEKEYNIWWSEYEPFLVRRKKKWVTLMKQNGLNLNNDNPTRFPPKSNKLKRYVRKGIPAEWRGNAWWYFARGDEKLRENTGLYDKIVESTINLKNHNAEIIERDLNRTFPDNIYFRDTENESSTEETPLIQSLRRVLVAFATYQPQIGYCQSLNFLAGLLLIFLDEEKAFWMLVIITSKLLPGVHDVNLEGVNIDQGVLMLCIKEYLPNIWRKIGFNFESVGIGGNQTFSNEVNVVTKLPPITLCTASWFMSAYIGILPIETCLRVWDCFFYEESKMFFRIALSILKLAESKIERIRDEMEIFQIVQNFPKKILDPKELFDCCFKKRNGFSNLTQEEINRCRKFVKEQRQKASKYQQSPSKFSGNKSKQLQADVEQQLPEEAATAAAEIRRLKQELDENYIPDEYDFKKNGLAGVSWNKALTKKLRKQRHKKK